MDRQGLTAFAADGPVGRTRRDVVARHGQEGRRAAGVGARAELVHGSADADQMEVVDDDDATGLPNEG